MVATCLFLLRFGLFRQTCGIMISFQKLLSREDKLFTLLESGAEEVCASVHALVSSSMDFARGNPAEGAAYSRQKGRQITEEIDAAVYTTFVTSMQREDIQLLSNALYRIIKTVDKFTQRALIAPRYVQGVDFSNQVSLLEAASEIVLQLVKSLRSGMNPKHGKNLIGELQSIENEGDKLMSRVYQEIYTRYDPLQAIFLKELYELLEKAIDCCRTAGNTISRIVLRNS